jgi:MYXO-CTERM domain-containing protein
MSKHALLVLAGVAALVGCSTAEPARPVEHRGISKQAMVGGTVSGPTQDSVIFLMKGQDESCSGTLIAPNLVLTARHCVATPDEQNECGQFGAVAAPTDMTIKVGGDASWESGSVVATGKKIFQPTTNNGCGFDAALILLDRDVPNAKISPVRFTPLKNGEPTIAVGYGVDQNDNELPKRMQRNTTVLGVGPTTGTAVIPYKMKDGQTFNYTAQMGDVVTGESTCSGDSGGPLFDANGAVVAMTSRGPFDSPSGGIHGTNGCADMVSIYASTITNKAMILQAAQEAGHPITDDGTTQSTKPATGDDDDSTSPRSDDDDDTSSGDDDDSSSSKKKPTKKKSTGADATAAGCRAAPGQGAGNGWMLVLGVGLALATSKRRASQK